MIGWGDAFSSDDDAAAGDYTYAGTYGSSSSSEEEDHADMCHCCERVDFECGAGFIVGCWTCGRMRVCGACSDTHTARCDCGHAWLRSCPHVTWVTRSGGGGGHHRRVRKEYTVWCGHCRPPPAARELVAGRVTYHARGGGRVRPDAAAPRGLLSALLTAVPVALFIDAIRAACHAPPPEVVSRARA